LLLNRLKSLLPLAVFLLLLVARKLRHDFDGHDLGYSNRLDFAVFALGFWDRQICLQGRTDRARQILHLLCAFFIFCGIADECLHERSCLDLRNERGPVAANDDGLAVGVFASSPSSVDDEAFALVGHRPGQFVFALYTATHKA